MDTNKVQVAFGLSSGFYSATKALSTPLPCTMIIVLLEPAFLFFVLTRGRPLPVTTFFVFSLTTFHDGCSVPKIAIPCFLPFFDESISSYNQSW